MTVLPFPSDGNSHARHVDPATSKTAARDKHNWEAIERTMLRCYTKAGLQNLPLADHEVMEECGWDMSLDGHRRRCSDLRKPKMLNGVVVRPPLIHQAILNGVPVTHVSPHSGKPRMACVLTDDGVEWVKNHGILREVLYGMH